MTESSSAQAPLLAVDGLQVEFATHGGTVHAVRGVSLAVDAGQTLAIVGESGCGKSVTVQSLMDLIPMPPGRIAGGTARWRGHDMLGSTLIDGREIRGREIGMIFQDPMSSLNPTMTIGAQIAEPLEVHRGYSRRQALRRAVELLERVRIPEAERRARQYPFEFSGGMLQRAMIAAAIACEPALLIADEPTTALDVTIQAQILDLLQELQRTVGMAMILITHDLAVVARMADTVAVMYAGQIVEQGPVDAVFHRSAHPYTRGLKAALPSSDPDDRRPLQPIDGSPPDLFSPPPGCAYAARCPHAMQICAREAPPRFVRTDDGAASNGSGASPRQLGDAESCAPSLHFARCWLHHPDRERAA